MTVTPLLQVCPNGSRTVADHPRVPITPLEVALAVAEAVEAGAQDAHVHPRDAEGRESMHAAAVTAVVEAVRAAVPGIPVGVTTAAWTVDNPAERIGLVAAWTVLPDHASVNFHEPGAVELAEAL